MKILLVILTYYYYFLSKITPLFLAKSKKEGVLYLAAFYPGNAGYHWRVKVWADELMDSGIKVKVCCVFTGEEFRNLYGIKHSLFLIRFLRERFKQVKLASRYETVIVRRELLMYNDYGNLFLDKMLLKLNKNVILDFDDDIAAQKGQPKKITNWFGKLLMEDGNKFNNALRVYNKFIVASDYLKERILKERGGNRAEMLIIPTSVDYSRHLAKGYVNNKPLSIGWIGGDHNYFLLDSIIPVLNKLSSTRQFKLIVIGASKYDRSTNFEIDFREWSLDSEVKNLLDIDIGIMPLQDTEISKGKGGFKLIQYMGLGIVSVASAVTINKEIVNDGIDSFLVETEHEWEDILDKLLSGSVDLKTVGEKARKKILNNYTVEANRTRYIQFVTDKI